MRNNWFPVVLFIIVGIVFAVNTFNENAMQQQQEALFAAYRATEPVDTVWRGWNKYAIPDYNDSGRLIRYGFDLIVNTAYYLGPKGTVAQVSNGMNCQNCHLEAGTAPFANNFGKVYATYPGYRPRNNAIQTIYGRIDDCLERSLNGKILDSNTREMRAMNAYISWLGNDIPKGVIRGGTGNTKIKYPDRAADPDSGKIIYASLCQRCHGSNGEGMPNKEATGYVYPPLWGEESYNDGAGLYRLGSFAAFVKNNMPFGADYHMPQLTDNEAWNVAAYVNSRPRPHRNQRDDWKDVNKKPVDFPFGPYADTFSEKQHKYGPFKPIEQFKKSSK
jgi:thiosulfate dehydrogenase